MLPAVMFLLHACFLKALQVIHIWIFMSAGVYTDILYHLAVMHLYLSRGIFCELLVVVSHHDDKLIMSDLAQKLHDTFCRNAVEIPCRLIGNY